jgi:hypothetical protein
MSNVEGERKLQDVLAGKTEASLRQALDLLVELRALRADPGDYDLARRQVANMLDVVDFLLARYIEEA